MIKHMNWFKKIFSPTKQDDKWSGTPYAECEEGYASIELVERLENAQKAQRTLVKKLFGGQLSGGPGFSQKSAWIVNYDNGIAVECEYKINSIV